MIYNIYKVFLGVKSVKLLKQRIINDGVIIGSDIVKVDNFLNHQVDPVLMREIALEIKKRFKDTPITKVLTIEASGIAIAAFVALELGVPFVFAKKYNARNLDSNVYESDVFSFTKQTTYAIRVSTNYINENDSVLIVDDFLAKGGALNGLIDIVNQAGASVSGCAIVIEKNFQQGGDAIRSRGYRVESLANIKSIENGKIEFV